MNDKKIIPSWFLTTKITLWSAILAIIHDEEYKSAAIADVLGVKQTKGFDPSSPKMAQLKKELNELLTRINSEQDPNEEISDEARHVWLSLTYLVKYFEDQDPENWEMVNSEFHLGVPKGALFDH